MTIVVERGDEAEKELVRGVCAGNAVAFEAMMRRYNQRLYRVARSILKDEAEAEDALQDAYWKAYRAMGDFRSDAQLSTWLTRIVINESLGRLKRAKRHANLTLPAEVSTMESPHAKADIPFEVDQRPDAIVWRAEIRALIEQKLDDLPDAFRTVFMLRAVEDMSAVEVAAVLDIPEATVRSRFFRARRLMRDAMAKEMDFHAKDAFSFAGHRCDRIVAAVLARLKHGAS